MPVNGLRCVGRVAGQRKGFGPAVAVYDIRDGDAERREHRTGIGQNKPADAEMARKLRAMGAGRAAIGIQGEGARIVSAFDRNLADQIGHARIHDFQDAGGGFLQVKPEGLGDTLGNCARRQCRVEFVGAAEEIFRIDNTADQQRVGDGRFGAAPAIGRRAGIRSRALRADMKAIAVCPGDAAAAGTDRHQLYRRQRDRQALVEIRPRVFFKRIAVDQADIETGAAHIGGDDLVVTELIAQETRRDQSADRAGIDDRDGLPADIRRPRGAAVRRDDLNRVRQSGRGQTAVEIADIRLGERPDIGVDDRGDSPFEFAHFRRNLMGQADRYTRCDLRTYCRYTLFMYRVAECPEKADSKAFGAPGDQALDGIAKRILVQRYNDATVRTDPLADAADHAAGNKRCRRFGMDKIHRHLLRQPPDTPDGAARDCHGVFEPGGEKNPDPGAAALDQRICRCGCAVCEYIGPREDIVHRCVQRRRRPPQDVEHAFFARFRRRKRFCRPDNAPVVDQDEIGKRSPGIDADIRKPGTDSHGGIDAIHDPLRRSSIQKLLRACGPSFFSLSIKIPLFRRQCMNWPPSTLIVWPEMKSLPFDNRNITVPARSSGY